MNALFLGAASLGALFVYFTHDPHANFAAQPAAVVAQADRGSMTHEVWIDPKTGEKTEINVIAFAD